MAEQPSTLRSELTELLLVAAGAVPGAVLRWQVALHVGDQNLLVNVLGADLLGLLAGLPAAPRRQLLVGKDGTVIARFKSGVDPEELKAPIEAALAA